MMKLKLFLFFGIILSIGYSAHSQVNNPSMVLGSDSVYMQTSGRMGVNKDISEIFWPGTTLAMQFKGSGLRVKLKDSSGKNYFNVIIDDDSLHFFKADTTEKWYNLAFNLNHGHHSIKLIKRNETHTGSTMFYGAEVLDGYFLPAPLKPNRKIEFIGNSITVGYAVDDTVADSPDSIFTNNLHSYAQLTAKYFNADYHCTAVSGIGIMVSWMPYIMPEIFGRIDPADSTSQWDFSKYQPDIVVVNLFQNDSWLVKKTDHPSFKQRFDTIPPDETDIVLAYQEFIKTVRQAYPNTHIICALGSMDATREGSPWPAYVQQAVNGLNDKRTYTLFFPAIKESWHPKANDHQKMAQQLIHFIEGNISW